MDQVIDSLKCVNCKQILSNPVLLPCEHLICKSHTETAEKQIVCLDCGEAHSNNGFLKVKAVEKMIKARLYAFDFGANHKLALYAWNNLNEALNENEAMLMNLENFIDEKIGEFKNKLLLKREELKLLVDQRTEEIINEMEAFQSHCIDNLRNEKFKSSQATFEKENRDLKRKCDEFSRQLNELKVDEDRWKNIINECDSSLSEIKKKLDPFVDQIFDSKLDCYKKKSNYFDEINLFTPLNMNVS